MTAQLLRKKFTIEEFQQIAESGIIKDEDRLELIEGEIIDRGKIGSKHAAYTDRLNDLLRDKLGKKILIRVQNPVKLNVYSQPQPDLVLVKRRDDYYEKEHPQTEDIFLLIEVSDSTLETDREIKIPLYAKHGILETWIINCNNQSLEVYRHPNSLNYQQKFTLFLGEKISCLFFPEEEFTVNQIMGM